MLLNFAKLRMVIINKFFLFFKSKTKENLEAIIIINFFYNE